nr:MAG TPA: hypothetical protein [Caudoviricetes sp.]
MNNESIGTNPILSYIYPYFKKNDNILFLCHNKINVSRRK